MQVHTEPVLPPLPDGALRLTYTSPIDGLADRAIAWPGRDPTLWFVVLRGHGSHEDQLYARRDIRAAWLPALRATGAGILTPNLRDNAWMSPAAAADLHQLLAWVRGELGGRRFLFYSGSMGGTGNLCYAVLHPEEVAGVAALGAAPDLGLFGAWCLAHAPGTIQHEIGEAIGLAYGGSPADRAAVYEAHSAIRHASRLTMPAFVAHGERDALMPADHPRLLAETMGDRASFAYRELAGGDHDSPLWLTDALPWLLARV